MALAWQRWSRAWLPSPPALVVLEATGGFETTAAGTLAAAGLPLVVVDPRQTRDFARATGRLAKTDRSMPKRSRASPKPSDRRRRRFPDQAAQVLGELVARLRQLLEMIISEGQRRRQIRDRGWGAASRRPG